MNSTTRNLALGATLVLAAAAAAAQTAAQSMPHPGPYLPPELRSPVITPAASGAELRKQAMDKLRLRFEQADVDGNGSLTRSEAERAGLGYVAASFDDIDTARRGRVSFGDVQKFMELRRKAQPDK